MIDLEKLVGRYINARFRSSWNLYGRVNVEGEGEKKTYTLEDASEAGNAYFGRWDHTYIGRIKSLIKKNRSGDLKSIEINPEAIDFYQDITDQIAPLYMKAGKEMPGQPKI